MKRRRCRSQTRRSQWPSSGNLPCTPAGTEGVSFGTDTRAPEPQRTKAQLMSTLRWQMTCKTSTFIDITVVCVAFVSCRVLCRVVSCVCVECAFCVVVCCAVSLCVDVGAGVGVQCVCVVWNTPPVCRFKTPPCVRSGRRRFESTHKEVFSLFLSVALSHFLSLSLSLFICLFLFLSLSLPSSSKLCKRTA